MKNLFPAILIALCILAGVSFASSLGAEEKEYAVHMERAEAALEKEYYVEAVDEMNQARKMIPSYDLLCRIADTYHKLGDEENYQAVFEVAVKQFPEEEDARVRLAEAYAKEENFSSLVPVVKKAVADFPNSEKIRELYNDASAQYKELSTTYMKLETLGNGYVSIEQPKYYGEEEENPKYSLIDSSASEVFQGSFAKVVPSEDGMSLWKKDWDGNWTRVNYADQLLARNKELKIEDISALTAEGAATAVINGKYYFLNKRMEIVGDAWDYAGSFSEGVCAVSNGGKWAIVTTENLAEPEYLYEEIAVNQYGKCCVNGVIAVKQNGVWTLADKKGKALTENQYEEITAFESAQPTVYKEGGKAGFLNRYGEVYLEAEFEDAHPFVNGYAAVMKNGKWGFVNQYGKIVVEPVYEEITDVFSDGRVYIKLEDGTWNTIQFYLPYYG